MLQKKEFFIRGSCHVLKEQICGVWTVNELEWKKSLAFAKLKLCSYSKALQQKDEIANAVKSEHRDKLCSQKEELLFWKGAAEERAFELKKEETEAEKWKTASSNCRSKLKDTERELESCSLQLQDLRDES